MVSLVCRNFLAFTRAGYAALRPVARAVGHVDAASPSAHPFLDRNCKGRGSVVCPPTLCPLIGLVAQLVRARA
jgi:hypothetical protein